MKVRSKQSMLYFILFIRIREEDKHPYLAIFLTTVSAFAATLGGAFVVFCYTPSPTVLGSLLGFSAGIMLYVYFFFFYIRNRLAIWILWVMLKKILVRMECYYQIFGYDCYKENNQ